MPESLKNILLVMASGGYLTPPEHEATDNRLWEETWRRLDRFLPALFAEVFPERAEKPQARINARVDEKGAGLEAQE